MKIKVIDSTYEKVMSQKRDKHKKPKKPNMFFRWLMRFVASFDLKKTNFKFERIGMDKIKKGEACLYLMNHSSFIDLEIVARILYPKPFNIITTTDAFVGKDWLLRQIGCIPTQKFVHDTTLVRDIIHATKNLSSNVVLFPEASYSFDGTATPIPDTISKLVKALGIPVVMIRTYGAFARDPLYNNIQVRKVDVSATETCLFDSQEVASASLEKIRERIEACFTFDNFKWQQENKIRIDAPTRADFLNRVLYKCPECMTEGEMVGKGIEITCKKCGKTHILDEYGFLTAKDGKPNFTHVPDWYRWEREEVKKEILSGEYGFTLPVEILISRDTKKLYRIGEGVLTHTTDGFTLVGCDGKLEYRHKALSSYSVYSDFNWYEIGDMICIGNYNALYYCFPKTKTDIVAKTRLAVEEIYKIKQKEARQ